MQDVIIKVNKAFNLHQNELEVLYILMRKKGFSDLIDFGETKMIYKEANKNDKLGIINEAEPILVYFIVLKKLG